MRGALRAALLVFSLGLALTPPLTGCAPPDAQRSKALLGAWVGSVTYRDASTPLRLEVFPDGDSLTATLAAPELGIAGAKLGRFSYAPPRIHLSAVAGAETLVFDGWFRRTLLVGSVATRAMPNTKRAVLLPQFGFQRPALKLPLAGVDSSYDAHAPAPPAPATTARADSLAAWLRAR